MQEKNIEDLVQGKFPNSMVLMNQNFTSAVADQLYSLRRLAFGFSQSEVLTKQPLADVSVPEDGCVSGNEAIRYAGFNIHLVVGA